MTTDAANTGRVPTLQREIDDMLFDPIRAANRFRIWQCANARGWDCTAEEIANALGMEIRAVAMICSKAGWTHRLRKDKSWSKGSNVILAMDAELEGRSAREVVRDSIWQGATA